jgi:hypothetical protein
MPKKVLFLKKKLQKAHLLKNYYYYYYYYYFWWWWTSNPGLRHTKHLETEALLYLLNSFKGHLITFQTEPPLGGVGGIVASTAAFQTPVLPKQNKTKQKRNHKHTHTLKSTG